MRRALLLVVLLMGVSVIVNAQSAEADLSVEDSRIITQLDAFGIETQLLTGHFVNNGESAYADITIFADLLDDDGEIIGEAFGYAVDTCGAALLDTPTQPDQIRRYALTIDLYEGDPISAIDDYAFFFTGTATEPEDPEPVETTGVTRISDQEIVMAEWLDENTLRFGAGCDNELFTTYEWAVVDLTTDDVDPLEEHPAAANITETFLDLTDITLTTQTREINETLLDRSQLVFPVEAERAIFQNDINTVFSSAPDGSFRRLIATLLSQFTLQGYVWSPQGNFLAYYFGGYGEGVRYFTANANGGRISRAMQDLRQSTIVPGISNDGLTAITGETITGDDGESVTGYWWTSTITNNSELLYEASLPGNNYPAPAYYFKDQATRYIYIVRDVDGVPTLECIHREADETFTLTPLPLQLETDERAWTWLSPERNTLALAADGEHGGLWLIDLNAFDACR